MRGVRNNQPFYKSQTNEDACSLATNAICILLRTAGKGIMFRWLLTAASLARHMTRAFSNLNKRGAQNGYLDKSRK